MKTDPIIDTVLYQLEDSTESHSKRFMNELITCELTIYPCSGIPTKLSKPKLKERQILVDAYINIYACPGKNPKEVYVEIVGRNAGKTKECFCVTK